MGSFDKVIRLLKYCNYAGCLTIIQCRHKCNVKIKEEKANEDSWTSHFRVFSWMRVLAATYRTRQPPATLLVGSHKQWWRHCPQVLSLGATGGHKGTTQPSHPCTILHHSPYKVRTVSTSQSAHSFIRITFKMLKQRLFNFSFTNLIYPVII